MRRQNTSRRVPLPLTFLCRAAVTVSLLAMCADAPPGAGARVQRRELIIINETTYTLDRIYISRSDSDAWGPDMLGDSVIEPGQSFKLTLRPGEYDIKIVDKDGDLCVIRDVPVFDGKRFVVTNKFLLNCEGRDGNPTPSPTPAPTPSTQPTPTPAPTARPTPIARPTPTARPTSTPTEADATPTVTTFPYLSTSPSPAQQARIDQILASMSWGNIAFNVPPSMTLDEPEPVVLALGLSQPVEELKNMVREENVRGNIQDERIKVADQMQAVLTGEGFRITAVTPDILPISRREPTEWKWDVTPLRPGRLRLHVILNALVDTDGTGNRPYTLRTFDKEYEVIVPWGKGRLFAFIGDNLQWLWTVLILPVAGWLWRRKRKKARKAGFV